MSIRWNWRLASRLSVITLAVLVVILVTVLQQRNQAMTAAQQSGAETTNAYGLQGTDLNAVPAPDFRLTDQFGKPVALSQFKGKPIVLTFLYTHCPDVCPLTAEKLHSALQMLGKDAQNVGVIAVSTDPQRDDQAAALSFSKAHRMQDSWHYLIGTQTQLSSVWTDYHIYAQQQQQTVNHSMGIYLIDKEGRQQVYEDTDFTATQLASNLKILLKQ